MTRLSDMQEKARKLIEEGLSILKSGMHDAGFLAESTAGAARLHVEASRKRLELYRALHDLGDSLFEAIKVAPAGESVKLTHSMAELIERALELERSLEHDEEELSRFSVVKGERGGSPAPVSRPPRQKKKPAASGRARVEKKAMKKRAAK